MRDMDKEKKNQSSKIHNIVFNIFLCLYNKMGDTLEKKKPKEKSQNEKARNMEKKEPWGNWQSHGNRFFFTKWEKKLDTEKRKTA
jgi:hypothetical protein